MHATTSARRRRCGKIVLLTAAIILTVSRTCVADEGGVSFWLPGLMGSLASVPGQPGLSWTTLYYHTSVDANGGKNFVRGGAVVGGLNAGGDLAAFGPTYTFAPPVLGGQLSVSLLGLYGKTTGSVSATLTGPRGRTISGSRSEDEVGF